MAMSSAPLRISGRHVKVTDAIRSHVNEKVGHAVRNHEQLVSHLDVNLSVRGHTAKGPAVHKVEITLFTKHHGVLRAEECEENMYATVDLVCDKLTRKLRRIKERDSRKRNRHRDELKEEEEEEEEEE